MKIKGKNVQTLIKAYDRLKQLRSIKAGYIKRYLKGITTKEVKK